MKKSTNLILQIKDILISRNETVSVSESLTSGLLQASFAEVSGISQCFEGGITAYSLNSKAQHLNIDKEHAKKVNCVSSQVAKEMAFGSNQLFGTNLSISTTGYAEPYESEGIKEALAYVSINYNGSERTFRLTLPKSPIQYLDSRNAMRTFVTEQALIQALEFIKEHE
jgi:nicotinamide-nucleotide amidase